MAPDRDVAGMTSSPGEAETMQEFRTGPVPTDPPLECDLVMKGGVTSGVVYPKAVHELAYAYRFRCIGGTSAGAIAAVLTAAAEYGRDKQGFEKLTELVTWFGERGSGGRTNLIGLFQPQSSTVPVFDTAVAVLAASGFWRRGVAAILRATRHFPWWALLGVIPGLLLLIVGIMWASGVARAALLFGGALLAVGGGVLAVAIGFLRSSVGSVCANGFGVCNGMGGTDDHPALTPWLHGMIADVSGKHDAPLTFGDLWGAEALASPDAERRIDLQVMTTNLTEGLPRRMPWDGQTYFFSPAQLRGLFPADVVDWMKTQAHAPDLPEAKSDEWEYLFLRALAREHGLVPFPAAQHTPVLLAARMSLSFPGLISAVPLWSIDRSRVRFHETMRDARLLRSENPGVSAEEAAEALVSMGLAKPELLFQVNWFSDGGICSNFPIHLFDAPLPRRPTLAINLKPFHPDQSKSDDDQSKNLYVPKSNRGGATVPLKALDPTSKSAIGSFLGLILSAARNWVDDSQLTRPGYRDRIVHVCLDSGEGGMNLDMDRTTIEQVADRGQAAAVRLVRIFAGSKPGTEPAPGWVNHRWIRYRTALAAYEKWTEEFGDVLGKPGTADSPSYFDMLGPEPPVPPPSYDWARDTQAEVARVETVRIAMMSAEWRGTDIDLAEGSPRPHPRLKQHWDC